MRSALALASRPPPIRQRVWNGRCFLQGGSGSHGRRVLRCREVRVPISVRATGVRFAATAPDSVEGSGLTPERRGERAAWQRGELIYATVTAFVEFDVGSDDMRWTGTPQGPYSVPLGTDATSLLMDLAAYPDDLLADLGISGYKVSRFDFLAAPRRVELDDELRDQLTLR